MSSAKSDTRKCASRRVLLAGCLLGFLLVFVLAEVAHALAGGGVGGFGGGGGGGGGGFGSGGGFGGGGGSEEGSGGGAFAYRGLLYLAVIVIYGLVGYRRHRGTRRREEKHAPFSFALLLNTVYKVLLWPLDILIEWRRLGPRARRVKLAAAEASENDPRFAPEVVRADAEQLFCAIQSAWSKDDRATLGHLVALDLMVEWEQRLQGFAAYGWSNQIELKSAVHVDYVGLRNATDALGKRAVVRITARVRDTVIDSHGNTIHRLNSITDTHHICEYWTLGVSGEGWMLLSIEQHHEGLHQLQEPILPSPWSDTQALQREATLEQAASTHVENGQIREIASADLAHDARAAALDISLIDDRFAPRVLTTEVQYAVSVWAQAIDGDDAQLRTIASPSALAELLYPGDPDRRRRLVLRGPRVRSLRILKLDAHNSPPSMLVELRISAHRYLEDRTTTTVVQGDRSIGTSFTTRWQMELTDKDTHPWRIATVTNTTDPSEDQGQNDTPLVPLS